MDFILSIVPSFLKSLLSYFSNIIIVSHINLIQGNVDETAEIKFDKSTWQYQLTPLGIMQATKTGRWLRAYLHDLYSVRGELDNPTPLVFVSLHPLVDRFIK